MDDSTAATSVVAVCTSNMFGSVSLEASALLVGNGWVFDVVSSFVAACVESGTAVVDDKF